MSQYKVTKLYHIQREQQVQRCGYDTGHAMAVWRIQTETLERMNVIIEKAKQIGMSQRQVGVAAPQAQHQ